MGRDRKSEMELQIVQQETDDILSSVFLLSESFFEGGDGDVEDSAFGIGLEFGILNFFPAPPAFALQNEGKFAVELFQRPALFGSIDDGGIDIGEHIHFGGFGHRNTICSLTTDNTPKLSDNRLEHRECRFTFDIQETK